MRLNILLFFLTFYVQTTSAQNPCDRLQVPGSCSQIILVTTSGWANPSGLLIRYEKKENVWLKVGEPVKVMVGRNGLGWGRGLHPDILVGPGKKEGDGKGPAGIFQLGCAFGYAAKVPEGVKAEYRQVTEFDFFVDDVQSTDYNRWIRLSAESNQPTDRWKSFERMKRKDHLYKLGMVVEHNTSPVVQGKGSAIFLHIWRMEGAPTAGCTSMSEENILTLFQWLDPDKSPLLIQVPEAELVQLQR